MSMPTPTPHPHPHPHPRPLTEWSDRYHVAPEPFAAGGMGVLWAAYDVDLQRDVAVKSIRGDLIGNPTAYHRFARETRILAMLDHPGVCPILDRFLMDEVPACTMKLVRGDTLSSRIAHPQHSATLDEVRDLVGIAANICRVLQYAHSRGVIHRDLKPDNVLLGEFGEVFVMDWGLARLIDQAEPPAEPLSPAGRTTMPRNKKRPAHAASYTPVRSGFTDPASVDGAVIGTPAYLPPELARGDAANADERTDVFGVGAILFAMLTGRPPIDVRNARDAVQRAQRARIQIPAQLRDGSRMPRELSAILSRALAMKPDDRYADADELRADLDAWLAGNAVAAAPDRWRHRVLRTVRRHPAAVLLSAALVGLLLVGGLAASLVVAQINAQAAQLAESRAAEQEARSAELEQAARASSLQGELGDQTMDERQRTIRTMNSLVREWATQPGRTGEDFRKYVGEDRLKALYEAYDSLLERAAQFPDEVSVSAADLSNAAYLARVRDKPDTDVIRLYQQALDIEPDYAAALQGLELALRREGRTADADAVLDRALAMKMGWAATRAGDLAMLSRHDLEAAEREYTRAIEWTPDIRLTHERGIRATALILRASIRIDRNNPTGAESDLRDAMRIMPPTARALMLMGRALAMQNRNAEAINALDHSLVLEPDSFKALLTRALVREQLGNIDGAMADFSKAIEADPSRSEPYRNRGRLHGKAGRVSEALRDYTAAVERQTDDATLWALCGQYWLMQQTEPNPAQAREAVRCFSEALARMPDDATFLVNRGTALALLHDPVGIADLRRVAELAPNDWSTLRSAAAGLIRLEQWEDAARIADRALRICPPGERPELERLRAIAARNR
ncbi:MAG: tetratricopeptide repeat protein [Planctomycetota bacterium]